MGVLPSQNCGTQNDKDKKTGEKFLKALSGFTI
jgi:hypothetical protein